MATSTWEIMFKTKCAVQGSTVLPMGISTMASSSKTTSMAKVGMSMQTVATTMAHGSMGRKRVKGTLRSMVRSTKANGPTTPKWGSGSIHGPMGMFIKESIFQILGKERGNICGRMERSSRGGGKQITLMVRPSTKKSNKKKTSLFSSTENFMPIDSHDIPFFYKFTKFILTLKKSLNSIKKE